ncbi:MAG: hypothetical protein IJG49_07035 [Erysipelotrichaceae bacterium]|nr:hypothetical protein [Erysipelotrichaceae bacterium]
MKTAVDVICLYPQDGIIKPLFIVWNNGARYPIDRIDQVVPVSEGECCGMRYSCRLGKQQRYLYLENGKWYIGKS